MSYCCPKVAIVRSRYIVFHSVIVATAGFRSLARQRWFSVACWLLVSDFDNQIRNLHRLQSPASISSYASSNFSRLR